MPNEKKHSQQYDPADLAASHLQHRRRSDKKCNCKRRIARCDVCYAPIPLKKSTDGGEVGCFPIADERRPRPSRRFRRGHRDQFREFAEVLGGGCEVELVAGAIRTS